MAEGQDRRRTPRFPVDGQLKVQEVGSPHKLELIDLGLGGFMITSAGPYSIGLVREFRFNATDDAWSTVLRARVAYSHRRTTAPGEPIVYANGFAFADSTPLVQQQIDTLVTRLTSSLIFKQ